MNRELELSFSPDRHGALPSLEGSASDEKELLPAALGRLRIAPAPGLRCVIERKSIDARNKREIRIRYRVRVTDEPLPRKPSRPRNSRLAPERSPVVVGSGPAGLFAALTLVKEGFRPVVIERGRRVERRILDVEGHRNGGALVPFSNVQFGEGGAGTFSDGKLYSGVSDERRPAVLDSLVAFGAPAEIRYLAHPHVGTDRLRGIVAGIRRHIVSLGGEFLFERTVNGFDIDRGVLRGIEHVSSVDGNDRVYLSADDAVLAVGHSARDTYAELKRAGVTLVTKPFSIGVRIEHPQRWLDRAQYGGFAGHPALGAAGYRLVAATSTGRSLYTFCMCPGGYVVAGASSAGQVVTNGMSDYARDGANANSAILVGVDHSDFIEQDVLAGVRFQESLEAAAFAAGGGSGYAPCQRLGDFLDVRESSGPGAVEPSFKPGVKYTDLRPLFPAIIGATIHEGVILLDRKLGGFAHPDSLLTGIETRSSSPVRIIRDQTLCSPDAKGLYPCGEGAGYAGGIMSSAIDGMRCAERIVARYRA